MLISEKQSLWQHLKSADKPIYIYGMGDGALKIIAVLERLGIPFEGIYASNDFVRGHSFRGYRVLRLAEVKAQHGENFISLLAFATFRHEMLEVLYQLQEECEFYAPDVPVVKVDDDVFDLDYVKRHEGEFDAVYDMLADEQSKKVFVNTLNFKISGKVEYLKEITTEIDEVYRSIIKPSRSDVYIDLGAYNGDTVSEFLRYSGGAAERIIALEPDKKNFKRLIKRAEEENILNMQAYNMGAWSRNEVLSFAGRGGRSSKLDAGDGTVEVQATSVDILLDGARADVINLDVEGAEREALLGCSETIRKYHPRLMISAYHKNEDLYALPMLVREICGGCKDGFQYKVFLRHHPYLPAWETNYYLTAE